MPTLSEPTTKAVNPRPGQEISPMKKSDKQYLVGMSAVKQDRPLPHPYFSTGKGGHYERGLFTGGISRKSRFSRISGKWSDSPLFSRVWGSLESLEP